MSTLRFRASLAERSAVSRHQDGCTIRLEVAESDLEAAIGVLALNKCVLWVSIEPEAAPDAPPTPVSKRASQRLAPLSLPKTRGAALKNNREQ